MQNEVKVGDIVWRIEGKRQNDEITYYPIPRYVCEADEYMFSLEGGGKCSLNCMGSFFFATRDECIEAIKRKHDGKMTSHISYDEPTPDGIQEYSRTNWDDFEVCKFDGVRATCVYLNSFNDLEQITNSLPWRRNEEFSERIGVNAETLTLCEISDYCEKEYPRHMITLIIEDPMHTAIFQYGNYIDYSWVKLGEVQGYA